MKTICGFSLLALVWSVYWLAMRVTGGVATVTDRVVAGCVIGLCSVSLVLGTVRWMKGRKK